MKELNQQYIQVQNMPLSELFKYAEIVQESMREMEESMKESQSKMQSSGSKFKTRR